MIQRGEDIKTSVQRFAKKLIGAIKAKEEHIFAAVENQIKKSLRSLGIEKSKLEADINMIETPLKTADRLSTRPTLVVHLKKLVETLSEQVVTKMPETLKFFQL